MKRPKLKKYVSPERVQETLDLMACVVENHTVAANVEGAHDVNDNYLLTLTEKVSLDYLVTGDQDLLVLERWQQTRIITFATFNELVQPTEL